MHSSLEKVLDVRNFFQVQTQTLRSNKQWLAVFLIVRVTIIIILTVFVCSSSEYGLSTKETYKK